MEKILFLKLRIKMARIETPRIPTRSLLKGRPRVNRTINRKAQRESPIGKERR